MPRLANCLLTALAVILGVPGAGRSADLDEFKVKRQEAFEFAEKPKVTLDATSRPDRFVVTFASKAFCDVTVAVEDSNGRIVRHLASGVLGLNAPEPLAKGSLRQALSWDGKDDRGRYVDDRAALSVRVSLGLKAQLERTLYWAPHKRISTMDLDWPMFRAAPEGVYVYDGGAAMDNVRLFDHDGNYVRTIYPFSSQSIDKVKGLFWKSLPDGQRVPVRPNYQQSTMLTSGTNCETLAYDAKREEFRYPNQAKEVAHFGQWGKAATAFAVRDGRIALACLKVNRLATDGTTGRFALDGPSICFRNDKGFLDKQSGVSAWVADIVGGGRFSLGYLTPERACFSPDGKWLYLTRYAKTFFGAGSYTKSYWEHVVMRVAFDGDEPPRVFLGESGKPGDDRAHLNMPASVDCDGEGRVYVADYYNNRVQVFSSAGEFLQSIAVAEPAEVVVHKKTGEVYVFCWPLCVPNKLGYELSRIKGGKPRFVLEKFSPLPKAQRVAAFDLPLVRVGDGMGTDTAFHAEVDSWTTPTTIWMCPGRVAGQTTQTVVAAERGDKLEVVQDFAADVRKQVLRLESAEHHRQRLYVHPITGRLYVAEGGGESNGKTFQQLLEIDPETGRVRALDLPVAAEDLAFDLDGQVCLRTYPAVVRYDMTSWREIPFDYGEELEIGRQKIASGVRLPADSHWHQGGMWVSPRGRIAVGCLYDCKPTERPMGQKEALAGGKKYEPKMFPGRNIQYNYGAIYVHVWDEHGKLVYDDAVPGLGGAHGLCIDSQDNLYVLAAGSRVLDGQPYYNPVTCTLMKFRPKAGRIVSTAGSTVPLSDESKPARPPDLARTQGLAWVEGAAWLYGGIGWDGKKGTGCSCWNARIAMDLFARTFAPEIDRSSIAVLDANGNLVLRIGRYGNVDDGKPAIADGGPANAHSIGGDEVSLFCAMYPATHSDRRLFVADAGNGRIVSVKLDYHATERLRLADLAR